MRSEPKRIICITEAPSEPADPEFLAVCDGVVALIADSIHCPPECGGHPICRPCYDLGVQRGLIRPAETQPSPGEG